MKPEVRGLVSRVKTKTLNVTSGICNIELIRQKNPRASQEMPVWMRGGSELRKQWNRGECRCDVTTTALFILEKRKQRVTFCCSVCPC